MSPDGPFASLAEHHLGPVLTRAGFAAGQWSVGPGHTSVAFTVTSSGSRELASDEIAPELREPERPADTQSGTYCTGARDYVARYPLLAAGREDSYLADVPQACLDVVVTGSTSAGVERVAVESEPLSDLLRHVDRVDDARVVDEALASGDAGSALPAIAAVFERLYRTGAPPGAPDPG